MTTVKDIVSQPWRLRLDRDVLALDPDSPVGARVVGVCVAADQLLALMNEPPEREAVREAVKKETDAWFFG